MCVCVYMYIYIYVISRLLQPEMNHSHSSEVILPVDLPNWTPQRWSVGAIPSCFLHSRWLDVVKMDEDGKMVKVGSSLTLTAWGNAIYNLRHPWLRWLHSQLEKEASEVDSWPQRCHRKPQQLGNVHDPEVVWSTWNERRVGKTDSELPSSPNLHL